MPGFEEHTIFWLRMYPGHNVPSYFGGIYGNSIKERGRMRKDLWGYCQTRTDRNMTEKHLDEALAKWQEDEDVYVSLLDPSGEILFSIRSEKPVNETVANALQSPNLESLYAYRKYAVPGEDVCNLVEKGVEKPETAVTPERVVLKDLPPSANGNDTLSWVLRANHRSFKLWDDWKTFVKRTDAIRHASRELYKTRDKNWDSTEFNIGDEEEDWVGVARVKCPVKGDEEKSCHVLARFYTVVKCPDRMQA